MSVSLKHFVDVNIKQHVSSAILGTRKTVALFTDETKQSVTDMLVTSDNYEDSCQGMTATLQSLKVFFDNGGQEAHVYCNTTEIASGSSFAEKVLALPQDYVCVAAAAEDSTTGHAAIVATAKALDASAIFYGISKKILLSRIPIDSIESMSIDVDCLAVKVSSVQGAEMTMAAYLSKINVYDIDSVYDYMYTVENIAPQADVTDAQYEAIIAKNLNIDIELSSKVRNCGGNMTNGTDIVNSYVLILLHQTVTARLLELLSQKIKSEDGISKIYAVISQELGNYLTCGYLTTDKVWTDPDLIISYNNENYTVIETGTALTDGYVVKVLPFSSLTENDKALHKTPPIYIVLASQYGIRAITINGEVI